MKPPFAQTRLSFVLSQRSLRGLLCAGLFGMAGCATKPAALPSQLYSDVGSARVGGPMRVAANRPVQRTPPRLPIVVQKKDPSLASADSQPPPPPTPTLSSSAVPKVTSPVPGEADTYFSDVPAETSALGGLFDSIFRPPTPPPTTTSSAKYRVVE